MYTIASNTQHESKSIYLLFYIANLYGANKHLCIAI